MKWNQNDQNKLSACRQMKIKDNSNHNIRNKTMNCPKNNEKSNDSISDHNYKSQLNGEHSNL